MVKFIRNLLGFDELQRETNPLKSRIAISNDAIRQLNATVNKNTRLDADINFRSDCTVILTGQYRGRGYVHFYDMSVEEFTHMVEDFRHRRKCSLVRNIDAPPTFKGVFYE